MRDNIENSHQMVRDKDGETMIKPIKFISHRYLNISEVQYKKMKPKPVRKI